MKPKTVDEYIKSFPNEQKTKLNELRKIIKNALPNTNETLKWGSPATLDKDGMILVIFSGHKNHMNFVATPSTKQAFEKELEDYTTGKGSVQLVYDRPIPKKLIEKMARYRAKEYREDKVNWK